MDVSCTIIMTNLFKQVPRKSHSFSKLPAGKSRSILGSCFFSSKFYELPTNVSNVDVKLSDQNDSIKKSSSLTLAVPFLKFTPILSCKRRYSSKKQELNCEATGAATGKISSSILENLALEIFKGIKKKDDLQNASHTNHTMSVLGIGEVLSLFTKYGISRSQMAHTLTKHSQVLQHPVETWNEAISNILDLGFHANELLPLLTQLPGVLPWTLNMTKTVNSFFDAMMALGFYSSQARKMLLSTPTLLSIKPTTLVKNHQRLLQLFPKSELTKMVLRSPHILANDPHETLAKFEYAQGVMGVQPKYLSGSNFLSKDLLFLETRHKLLERAGLYEKPDRNGVTKIQNPSFKNIVDTDDRYFAVKVCGLTRTEYRSFIELYKLEKETDYSDEYVYDDEGYTDDEICGKGKNT